MFKLLKGGFCFTPDDVGKKDLLTVFDRICRIGDNISGEGLWPIEVLDCTGKIVCPGFIDQHVHITGGGGEEGPVSRIPELMLGDAVGAGVTTVVGVLGVDGITRSVEGLLTKARALEQEGISTFVYTGSYSVPTATVSGKVARDIALIDKVIGVGEIAISDHRSSHAGLRELLMLASEARIGGMIGGKAGVMHIHVGDGKTGLKPLFQIIDESEYPLGMFVPTHLNRNGQVFEESLEFIAGGGNVDYTAGEKTGKGIGIPDVLETLLKKGMDLSRVTITSDANGSIPASGGGNTGVGKISQLFDDVRECIVGKHISIDTVIRTVTTNVARILNIYPRKGCLSIGSDADILVLDKEGFTLRHVLAKGEIAVKDGRVIKKGRYEK